MVGYAHQTQNAIAFVCLLCEVVVQVNLAARSEGGVEHTQKVARARGEHSLVELHADPHRPNNVITIDSLVSMGRGAPTRRGTTSDAN